LTLKGAVFSFLLFSLFFFSLTQAPYTCLTEKADEITGGIACQYLPAVNSSVRMWHFLNGKLCSERKTITVSSKPTWIRIMTPVAMASAAIIAIFCS